MKRLFLLVVFLVVSVQADAAKMSSYTNNTTPNGDVYFVGVDPNDPSQTANGSNYRYSINSIMSLGLIDAVFASLSVSGAGDSWLELNNNASFSGSLVGKYGYSFLTANPTAIINGTTARLALYSELGSFAFDTYPTYEDSAHSSGIAVNGTTLAIYSTTASKWLTVALTDTLDPTPDTTDPVMAITTPAADGSWVDSVTYTLLAGTASDNIGVQDIYWKLESGGTYANTNVTGTTTWSVSSITLQEGLNSVYVRARDAATNDAEAIRTINVDTVDPVIGTITPSSLTHDGTGETFTADITGVTEANEDDREWSLYDVTDAAIQVSWTTFTGLSISGISIPADQHTYRLDVRGTDLAGNIGTASSSNIVYSAGASVPDFQWNLDDNAASTTVLATYGGINGTLAGSGNTSDAQTGDGLLLGTSGYVGMALPTATFTAGSWTIQAAYDYVAVPSSQWPRLIAESSGGNEAVVWWDTVTQRFRVYINGVATDPTQTVDFTDGVKRYIRLVWNASNTTAYLYMGTSELNLSLVHSWAGTQPNAWGGTTYIGSGGGSGFWRGVVDDVKMWDEAVIP